MKKVLRVLLSALLIPVFILFPYAKAEEPKRFTNLFFNTFDTVISLIGYAPDQETFDSAFQMVEDRFIYLHRLFDKYNAYAGVNNLYTVNHQAAQAPVKVAPELMEVLRSAAICRKSTPERQTLPWAAYWTSGMTTGKQREMILPSPPFRSLRICGRRPPTRIWAR
jgi:thiamine biosynthesis lipoprotein